jgi:glucose-6-phosphate dehydrogenase assembly protein OpcA
MAQDMSTESSTIATSLDEIRNELARTKLSASTLNFVVWIDDLDRRDWILERTAMLSDKYPSLTIVLDHTGECKEAVLTTGDRAEHVEFTVQGERVLLDVSCCDAAAVLGYVTALSKTAVPTILWWSGMKEASRETFYALLPLVNTLLFDSSGGSRDASAMERIVAFHHEHPDVELRDLAWMRLRPWQDVIANFFDDPQLRAELYAIRRVYVASGSDSEALYLGAWLAGSLDWTPAGRDAFTDRAGRTVTFQRRRVGEIRRVQSICLDSETSWYHGEVTEDPGVVRFWVEGEHAREVRLVPLAAIDSASLLERAVLEAQPDELFESVLRTAATLLG